MKTRLFFATDVHSSTKTFLKFLSAAKVFKADALILGGDVTGKMLVPIIDRGDGTYETNFLGIDATIKDAQELEEMKNRIRNNGYYYHVMTPEELKAFAADPKKADSLLEENMLEVISQWVRLAEERLKGTGVTCYITGGNDDPFSMDDLFRSMQSNVVFYCEGKVSDVRGHEMIGIGNSNLTPWRCPRDITEEELSRRIESVAQSLRYPSKSIFNIHVPPFKTGLDTAFLVNDKQEYVKVGGQPVEGPVGSTAVRSAIERYQPLVGLHGHIHESRAVSKIGRTVCINPGSEYGESILRGVLVILEENKVAAYQLTSG